MKRPIHFNHTNRKQNSLINLLIHRLDLWDQQETAQASGEWHQALTLEQRTRELSTQIREHMGLLVPVEEVPQ